MSAKKPKSNIAKSQKFEMIVISRDQIKNAPYNPRVISDANKARLKKSIRKHGLVQPLVWNQRTGNLVAGHQRIPEIDAIEKRSDYEIMVAAVDVDEREERVINVALNNESMMGEWDTDKLNDMLADFDINPVEMGFSEADISILFGDYDGLSELIGDIPEVTETKDTLRKIKEDREAAAKKMAAEQNPNYYFTVVCDSAAEKSALLKRLGVPEYEEFIGSFAILRALDRAGCKKTVVP